MMKCGLLGRTLKHSYSPVIHAMLGDYDYELYELAEAELPAFLANGPWDGLNVTIPYKKTVLPFCDTLSEEARRTGSVNTLVRRGGKIFGDNTDVAGFRAMAEASGLSFGGKKALVLGSGGASAAVCAALEDLGAKPVVISRRGENNYKNLDRHADARYIVNTTPLGMFPGNGVSPLDPEGFPDCQGVFDVIYNPARTALLLRAEELGIPCFGGLRMLVAQARRSSEDFTGKAVPDDILEPILGYLEKEMRNIILIGMPGCGKSTLASMLSTVTGRPFRDSDSLVEERTGRRIRDILMQDGEESFRMLETAALRELGKLSGRIIATGGGCITRTENYPLLHQNGIILWIRRDLRHLPKNGRPLSQSGDLVDMYRHREPLYRFFSDGEIDNNGTPEESLRQILEVIG
jgi:shikimate dehydrogenase